MLLIFAWQIMIRLWTLLMKHQYPKVQFQELWGWEPLSAEDEDQFLDLILKRSTL
jgi:hypothetical protein